MKSGPKILLRQKQAFEILREKYMAMGDNLKKVIFSDEKGFNFDGPDGLTYYWRDPKRIKIYIQQKFWWWSFDDLGSDRF